MGKSPLVLCNTFSQSLWFPPRSLQQMIDNKTCPYTSKFQSWERKPIRRQDKCRRKAQRLHHSGMLGFARRYWHRALILGLDILFRLKAGTSQVFFFQVELTLGKQAALAGVKPDNLSILLIRFWDLCWGSLTWKFIYLCSDAKSIGLEVHRT